LQWQYVSVSNSVAKRSRPAPICPGVESTTPGLC
jgi:hypothetical protein